MRRTIPLALLCTLLAVSGARAQDTTHAGHHPAPAPGAETPRPRRDPELITAEELQRSPAANLLRAIIQLRGNWLRTRAVGGGAPQASGAAGRVFGAHNAEQTETVVYVDRIRTGGRLVLQDIHTRQVDSVRFVPGSQAVRRWGASHREGAVLVFTRR